MKKLSTDNMFLHNITSKYNITDKTSNVKNFLSFRHKKAPSAQVLKPCTQSFEVRTHNCHPILLINTNITNKKQVVKYFLNIFIQSPNPHFFVSSQKASSSL